MTPRRRRMTPRRRRNRRAVVVIGAVLVVLVVIGVVLSQVGSDAGVSRTGSVKIRTKGQFTVGAIDSYRVVYRVENDAGGDHVVSTDDLTVRRPFESRLVSRVGAPLGTNESSVTISSFGMFTNQGSPTAKPLITAVAPGLPGSDTRFDASIADLASAKTVEVRERRRVLGRDCQVYRTGEPIGTGRLVKPTSTDYADECIDAKGLMLEEVWFYKGHMVRRRVAVQVDEHPSVDATTFVAPAPPLPVGQGGSQLVQVPDTQAPPPSFLQLDGPPPGYTHQGRYEVSTIGAGPTPGLPGPVSQITSDVYVNGPNVLLIEQGPIDGHDSVFASPADQKLQLPALPGAELVLGVYGNVVRAKPDEVRYVRVLGTMPAHDLVTVAGHLKPRASA